MAAQITAITQSRRHPDRFVVQIDGAAFATLSSAVIGELKLRVGAVADDELCATLTQLHHRTAAVDIALRALAQRGRSRRELHMLLLKKKVPSEYATSALERLVQNGTVNDTEFAFAYARSKANSGTQGRAKVRADLQRKGIDRSTAERAVSSAFGDISGEEQEQITKLATRRMRQLQKLDPKVQMRRLYGFLARRGFDSDDIMAVVKRVVQASAAD